jgi:EAL domain-containing protein (putative c-di-GMP-specific phosphodiesterase class I)/DNA-binding response OmpR family regulator
MTKAERAGGRKATRDDPGVAEAAATGEDAYRVLIVEDDRSQALFAESVLAGAGMRTQTAATAAEAVPALDAFAPDLVLMDLHLPDVSGAELTAIIRARPGHAHLPIVFLTGDPDPETEYRLLDSGADDFLSKPIRPRHLVAAVHNRIKRARQIAAPARGGDERDPITGLYRRDHILARLPQAPAALLVEIQNLAALQERLGYAGVEEVLRRAGARLAELTPDGARLNDNSFLVLGAQAGEQDRTAAARRLRDGLARPIEHAGMPLRLRVVVAHIALEGDAARDPIGAIERTLRQARTDPSGIAGFKAEALAAQAEAQAALRAALESDRLELAFQPIASVAGGDEAQFQVLLRMRDAQGELHSAAALVGQAEAAGLLDQIDRRVLELAIGRLAPGAGPRRPERLFVSQSPQAIAADPDGARLRAALEAGGVAPSALVIDLRMDDALVHGLLLAEFCERVAPLGVGFCLGQYVHGEAAAALLRQLPLSYLRLAPRYSRQDAEHAMRDELRTLVEAAHAAGLRVIGSQVESPSAAATLWMSGIDYIQGNLVQSVGQGLDFDFHHSVL